MRLEDYFEFEKFDTKFGPAERIRIKGHRIRLENVVEYFNQGMEPKQIVGEIYRSLNLEEVYAAITYYLHNRAEVDAYIQRGQRIADAWYQEYLTYGPYFLRDRAGEYAVPPPPSDLPANE